MSDLDNWSHEDVYRLGAFLKGGMEPEKAIAVVNLVRNVEADHADPRRHERLMVIYGRLVSGGMDEYIAFTALLCHPSDHEPYRAIGSDYLARQGVL